MAGKMEMKSIQKSMHVRSAKAHGVTCLRQMKPFESEYQSSNHLEKVVIIKMVV